MNPPDGTVTANPFPGFTWKAHPEAFLDVSRPVEYEIRISAKTSGETQTIDEDRVALNRYVHDRPLAAGSYEWQVRSIRSGEQDGTWSAPSSFTIREPDKVVMVDVAKGLVAGIAEALKMADENRGKSVRIVVPPGDHPVDPSFKGALFDVSGRSDVVIDGTGARIRFSSRKQGLLLAEKCQHIAVIGFDCSFAKGSLRVQGRVRAFDPATHGVTVAIDEGFPGFDASDSQSQDIFYLLEDEKGGRLKSGAPNFFRADGPIVREADGTWSFQHVRHGSFFKVGDRYGYNFRSGSAHLIDASGSHGITASGLTTTGWGGMQFVSMEGGDFRILHCTTRFGEGEWMTGNADGVHIRGHDIGPWIEGLHIDAIGDDGVALYARPSMMKSVEPGADRRMAVCRNEFFNLEAGDDVAFFQPMEGRILLETQVETVSPVDGGFTVTFAAPLPDDIRFKGPLQQATQIWNRSKSCGDFIIRRSSFLNIRRYGSVFRAKRGVVENNQYRGISSRAVVFRNEGEWPNGLYASDIIVRGNTIIDAGFDSAEPQAPVAFLFEAYRRSAACVGPRRILIENNLFEDCARPEIQFNWVGDAVVRSNRARSSDGSMIPTKIRAKDSTGIRDASP